MADKEQELRQQGEKGVRHEGAQITGRTDGPYGPDDTDVDRAIQDNKNQDEVENSANGLDSVQIRGGQDGRNNRGIGSTDMDSENGLLRFGDQDDDLPEDVTQEGLSQAGKSNTSMANVTTHGPDDYASDDEVPTPKAQEKAKEQGDSTDANDSDTNSNQSQEEKEEEVSQTGTSTSHQPAY